MLRIKLMVSLGMLLLSACSPRSMDCASPEVFCAGMVTAFGPVDAGINREAWLGLQDALTAHLVDHIDYIQTVDTRDRAANIDVLAGESYDLIVTVGSSIADETAREALRYPRLKFIGVEQPQDKKRRNVAGLVFHEDYSGFLAGVLAARMTQTRHVAAACEAQFIDPVRRYCEGFQAGVHHADPDIEVTVAYREGPNENLFNDPDWGRATALEQVVAGADVIFATGGRTAEAALEAAASEGVYVIGSETDLYLDLPDIRPHLLSSATSDIRPNLVEMLTLTRRGKFPAGEYMGSESLAPWHDLDRRIPSDVKQELDQLYAQLALNSIELDIPYIQP